MANGAKMESWKREDAARIEGQPPAWISCGAMDGWLLASVLLLLLIGQIMVLNTTYFYAAEHSDQPYRFVWKQAVALVLGMLGMGLTARLSSASYWRCAYPALLLAVVGLIVALLSEGQVRRWIHLGVLNFQPSEFAKGAVVLYLAYSLVKKAQRLHSFVFGVLPHVLVVGLIALLIVIEPDLGGAAFVGVTLFVLLFIAGARKQHLAVLAAAGLMVLTYGIMTADYRSARLLSFLDPVAHRQAGGYQLHQSLLAFGAGGVHGVGLGQSSQKMFYLPEAHTDFVFAVVGEETGLWGTGVILGLFAVVGARGVRIALRHPYRFGQLLAFGCSFLLVGQAGLNMAVVLGMIPTKGLPLPFISYGGSSLCMALVYVGVLLGLSREIRRENQTHA
jgi:cell division protein FtsW